MADAIGEGEEPWVMSPSTGENLIFRTPLMFREMNDGPLKDR